MGALRLKVNVCDRIGYCRGITRAIKMLMQALAWAWLHRRCIYYKEPPHEAMEMIRKFERRTSVREWHDGMPEDAIQMISPYGAGPEAYECPHIDGTCPNVATLRMKAQGVIEAGYQLVIMAEADSSEIAFINRFIGGRARTISQFSDVEKLSLMPGTIFVLSQTSFRMDLFWGLVSRLEEIFPKPDYTFVGEPTVCREVELRLREITLRTNRLNDPATRRENLTFEEFGRLFPYGAVVLVGSFESKQCSWMAVELWRSLAVKVVRVEGPGNLCGSQFRAGQRVLVSGGPEVSRKDVIRVVRKLRRLKSGDLATDGEDPGLCTGCESRGPCLARRRCLNSCDMVNLFQVLAEMETEQAVPTTEPEAEQ